MTSRLVTPSLEFGYSRLFLDFIADAEPVRSFFGGTDVGAIADRLREIEFDREKLVAILRSQNESFEASPAVFATIEKLRDPRAVCVFSGQQAGLLGGPLLTIHKAIAIVKAAALYEKELGRPVVPIFWIAGDDHDFYEANHTWLIAGDGAGVKIEYRTPPDHAVAASDIRLDDKDELDRVKALVRETCGQSDFTKNLYDLIDRAYTENDTLVSGFGKLMAGLTVDIGLPFFDPASSDAKKLAAPFFKRVVEKQAQMHSTVNQRNDDIRSGEYHIQVEKPDDATYLFFNHNGRKPIKYDADRFIIGELSFTKQELVDQIENAPERFSPDVITRPILQSWLFPTLVQLGGPSEVAYFAQMNQLFELFDRPAPFVRARASVTIVEKRYSSLMDDHDIGLGELKDDIEQVINRVLAKSFPEDLEQSFEKFRAHLRTRFEDFAADSLKFDPALQGIADQTAGKIDFSLKAFEGKVFARHKKKSRETRDRIYRLGNVVAPDRTLQERKINICYFVSKYSFDIVRFIYDRMDPLEKSHQLLNLAEINES